MKMKAPSIGLMIYGEPGSIRNAITEDKYKSLASALMAAGFNVESVLFHNSIVEKLAKDLLRFQAILVWVNPIEQGNDRRMLDALLTELSSKGVFISTHPEVIFKIGTKDVLFTTRHMSWGGDIELYPDFEDFAKRFIKSLQNSGIRILKQHRGNGGNGVFKVQLKNVGEKKISVIHAITPNDEKVLSQEDFLSEFKKYFENKGLLVNQRWVHQITNGMVRCYLTGTKVSGFGYQEFNALCPESDEPDAKFRPPSKRYYYSEDCGLFQDLRLIMESLWVSELQQLHSIPDERLPLLWDADFFINEVNSQKVKSKYTLCEINVSSVSPFPESCIPHIVTELKKKIEVI